MTSAYGKRRGPGLITILFGLIVIACAAYSAYWFIARGVISQGLDDWIAEQRADGLEVEYTSRKLSGFPFRFVLDVEEPVYGAPRDGWRWQADDLQIVMQPWNYYHAIARAPGRHEVQVGRETLNALLGRRSAMSLRWDNTSIRQVSLALDELSVSPAGDGATEVDDFEFHLRPAPGEPHMLQLETHWQEVRLAEALPEDLAALGSVIGPSILRAELDEGIPAFSETGDLGKAVAFALRAGGEVRIPQMMLEWGPAKLGARANLAAPDGEIAGSAGLRIEEAEALRAALLAQGQLTDDLRQSIDALETASANGGFFTVSIRGDGLYFLGNRMVELPLEEMLNEDIL